MTRRVQHQLIPAGYTGWVCLTASEEDGMPHQLEYVSTNKALVSLWYSATSRMWGVIPGTGSPTTWYLDFHAAYRAATCVAQDVLLSWTTDKIANAHRYGMVYPAKWLEHPDAPYAPRQLTMTWLQDDTFRAR